MYGKWVNPVVVRCLALRSMNVLTVPTEIYTVVSVSVDKWTNCKSLWIKASGERPESRGLHFYTLCRYSFGSMSMAYGKHICSNIQMAMQFAIQKVIASCN